MRVAPAAAGHGRCGLEALRAGLVAVVLVLLTLSSVAACSGTAAPVKLRVVATIFPVADFISNIAGNKVDLVTLVPAGVSPHGFEPTADQVKSLAEAHLLIMNGAGLESWVELAAMAAGNRELLVTDASDAVPLVQDPQG